MKKLLILIFLTIPFISFSQSFNAEKFEFSEVVQVDSLSADELYQNANKWFLTIFKNPEKVIQSKSQENHTITGKGSIHIARTMKVIEGNVSFIVYIQCKDGRYKYTFSDFYHSSNDGGFNMSGGDMSSEKPNCSFCITKKQWQRSKDFVKSDVEMLIASIKEAMDIRVNDDW